MSHSGRPAAAMRRRRRLLARRRPGQAGQIYYMKWTSGMFASGIKVKLMDPLVGAKEMSKLLCSAKILYLLKRQRLRQAA